MNYAEEKLPDYLDMDDLAVEYTERFGGHSAIEDLTDEVDEVAYMMTEGEEY